tara:strand:- start:1104 stop:1541 length:438 start_codon:yes stop_codon:yes gene_type:complete
MECEIKIDELLKCITMGILSTQSMEPELGEWLDFRPKDLFNDVKTYIGLEEGAFTKEEIENKILGGPGESGLSMMMEMYENEWSVICNNANGEEVEMNLSEAMTLHNVGPIKTGWRLEELDPNWNSKNIKLIDEDDENDIEYYEM